MKNYDIVIIGGGISGIYTMYNLEKKYPNLKVLLLEKEDRFGGRVYTFNKTIDGINYNMDLGAGRIGYHHVLMMQLIHELKLDKYIVPIDNTENYIEYNKTTGLSSDKSNIKKNSMDMLYKFLNGKKIKSLSNHILQKLYLNELLCKFFSKKEYNNIETSFEYPNKLFNLNSNDAIKYFTNDYTKSGQFFIMSNGYSSIIDKMIEKISQNKNYRLEKNMQVDDIIYDSNHMKYKILYRNLKNNKSIDINIYCNNVICALPRQSLLKFDILRDYRKDLDTINEISKVRIFEIYNKDENGNMWFKNIPKTITNDKLQFVIPINSDTGLIMSSYNENLSTKKNYWNELYKKGESVLKTALHKNLNKIFNTFIPDSIIPDSIIPESKFIKFYYWPSGVACWKKNVDSDYISQKILSLLPNFYICGENYSKYQAWCEGSLMSSKQVLEKLDCVFRNKKKNKSKNKRGRKKYNKTKKNRKIEK